MIFQLRKTQSRRLRWRPWPERLARETDGEIAAARLDGPQHAPRLKETVSLRVRIEAWSSWRSSCPLTRHKHPELPLQKAPDRKDISCPVRTRAPRVTQLRALRGPLPAAQAPHPSTAFPQSREWSKSPSAMATNNRDPPRIRHVFSLDISGLLMVEFCGGSCLAAVAVTEHGRRGGSL